MFSDTNLFLLIVVMICFFVYNIVVFDFATKILDDAKRNPVLFLFYSTLNTLVLSLYFELSIPVHFFYSLCLIVFTVEFYFMSKTSFKQVVFGASVFTIHITAMHLICVIIMSWINGVATIQIIENNTYRLRSAIYLALGLLLALIIVKNIIPIKHLQRTSKANLYSLIITSYVIIVIIYLSIMSYLLLTENYVMQSNVLVAAVVVFSMMLFYFIFLYIINFNNMIMYKRHSDDAENEYKLLVEKKVKMLTKVEKDGLTGL